MLEKLHFDTTLDGRVGLHVNRGPSMRRMHRHAELEANLVVSGRARYIVNAQRYELEPGMLIWLFPAQEHLLVDESADFRMWVDVFRTRMVRRAVTTAANAVLKVADPAQVYCRRLSMAAADGLLPLHEQAAAVRAEPDHFNAALAHLLLRCWWSYTHADPTEIGSDVHPAVQRAAQVLNDDPAAGALPVLARRCGLSPSRLSRLFRQQTGLTLGEYRNRLRVRRFLDRYGRGRRFNLTQAAQQAGFGSYPQFHRVFRRVMGCSPAAYGRQQRGE